MIKVILSDIEKELWNGEAKKVIISTNDGEISVLRGHEPLMTTVSVGQVIIEKINEEGSGEDKNNRDIFSVYNGVVNIENEKGQTRVVILVENTENLKDFDEQVLKEAVEAAKKANEEKQDPDFNLDSGILRDMNKLKLSRRYR